MDGTHDPEQEHDHPVRVRRTPGRRAGPVLAAIVVVLVLGIGAVGAFGAPGAGDHPSSQTIARASGSPAVSAAPPSDTVVATQSQTIGLDVLGGSLSVAPGQIVVGLVPTGDGSRLTGTAIVDVVDARGSLRGWHLRVQRAAVVLADDRTVADAGVEIVADRLDVLAGSTDDTFVLRTVHDSHDLLAAATPGGGGGAFRVRMHVVVDLPEGVRVDAATLAVDLVLR